MLPQPFIITRCGARINAAFLFEPLALLRCFGYDAAGHERIIFMQQTEGHLG